MFLEENKMAIEKASIIYHLREKRKLFNIATIASWLLTKIKCNIAVVWEWQITVGEIFNQKGNTMSCPYGPFRNSDIFWGNQKS